MHRICKTLLMASVAMASPALAQTRPGFELGGEAFDYSYKERLAADEVASGENSVVVQDDGTFAGLTLGYVETVGSGWFLRSRLSVDFGSVDYRSGESRIQDVSQTIGQLEFHAGRDFRIGSRAALTPFVGVGSRILRDNSGGEETSDGLVGYDRKVSYSYVPVGVAASFGLGSSANPTISGQYNWLVGGRVTSEFSQVDPDFPDVKLNLDRGHGLEASAVLGLPLGKRQVQVGPFVRQWRIARSESATFSEEGETLELFEPRNQTTELGIRISLGL